MADSSDTLKKVWERYPGLSDDGDFRLYLSLLKKEYAEDKVRSVREAVTEILLNCPARKTMEMIKEGE